MSARNYFDVLTVGEDQLNRLLTATAAELRSRKAGGPQKKAKRKSRGRKCQKPEDSTVSVRYTFLEVEGRSKEPEKVSERAKLIQRLLEMKVERKAKEQQAHDTPVTVRHVVLTEGGRIEPIVSRTDVSVSHGRSQKVKAVVSPLELSFPTLLAAAKKTVGKPKPVAVAKEEKVWNAVKTRELFTAVNGEPRLRDDSAPTEPGLGEPSTGSPNSEACE